MDSILGKTVSRYRVVARIGETGAVYKAEDKASGRTVTLRFLPEELASEPQSVAQFREIGRAVATLNHRHIAAVCEVGEWEGRPFWASSFPEGEPLAQRLAEHRVSFHDLLDLGVQISDAFAAAQAAGIVHGGLEPAAIFVARQCDVRVADFGLALLGAGASAGNCQSPEQVKGEQPDTRADLFALGAILYEMATGESPFSGTTPEDVRHAILEREPPAPSQVNPDLPARFDEIVSKAIEKDRELRYQSAVELRTDLRRLRRDWDSARVAATRAALAPPAPPPSDAPAQEAPDVVPAKPSARRRWGKGLGLVAALLLAAGAGAYAFRMLRHPAAPLRKVIRPLTFRQGRIDSARFGPGGDTIYYTARWNGAAPQVYSVSPGSQEPAPLGLSDAEVLSISQGGDLAVLMNLHLEPDGRAEGNLVAVSLGRGERRPILENVEEADWSPKGSGIAVVRRVGGMDRLEYPIGNVLDQTKGWIGEPRFSPRGNRIAFIVHPQPGGDAGSVVVQDLSSGKRSVLSAGWENARGLAWSANGRNVWFTAGRHHLRQLYSAQLSGQTSQVLSVTGSLRLEDIARNGRVLLAREDSRREIAGIERGQAGERNLSWLNDSLLRDVSADGKMVLFNEAGPAGGDEDSVYVRGTDGSAATRVGQGRALALSPDGRSALTQTGGARSHFVLFPVGAGTARSLPPAAVSAVWAAWLPGGKQFVFLGRRPGKGLELFVESMSGGAPQVISPAGLGASAALSPNGRLVAAIGPDGKGTLYPVGGGRVATFRGIAKGDRLVGWSRYGNALFVAEGELPVKLFLLNLTSGAKTLLYQLAPSRPDGVVRLGTVRITSDGRVCLFSYRRLLSRLFLAEGLR